MTDSLIEKSIKYLNTDAFKHLSTLKYISYSCSALEDYTTNSVIPGSTHITDEVISLIMNNGYAKEEIKKYFDNGAVWFGVKIDNKLRSICFAYQNYDSIWEIAGVHTLESERHKGYARMVVISALTHLLKNNLIPRYEADVRNTNSVKLAQSLKMKEFLRINHFLLSPVR